MKAIFGGLFAIFTITALATHIWTVIIAYQQSGFWGAVVTLAIPVISELYWMFKMFGQNNMYAIVALIHLIVAVPVSFFRT